MRSQIPCFLLGSPWFESRTHSIKLCLTKEQGISADRGRKKFVSRAVECYINSMGNSKGQNVIEYVLLVAAVVIVCVYFISSGPMRQTLNATLNSMVNEVKNLNSQIKF